MHLSGDYEHVAEHGFRYMAGYENAMSLSGWDLGDAIVRATRRGLDERQGAS